MRILAMAFLVLSLASGLVSAQNYIVFNGGISQEERASAPSGDVRLVFFVRGGAFVTGVSVTVSNEAGDELVNTVTEGPWLVLDLPAGEYRVLAELAGERQGASFSVNGTEAEVGLMFSSVQ